MKNGTRTKSNGAVASHPNVHLRAQIEFRAYEIWKAEGGHNGDDLNHWLQAERELLEPGKLRTNPPRAAQS